MTLHAYFPGIHLHHSTPVASDTHSGPGQRAGQRRRPHVGYLSAHLHRPAYGRHADAYTGNMVQRDAFDLKSPNSPNMGEDAEQTTKNVNMCRYYRCTVIKSICFLFWIAE